MTNTTNALETFAAFEAVDREIHGWKFRAQSAEAKLTAQAEEIRRMREAAEPFARFIQMFDAKPLRGLDDSLYGIHVGTEWEAEIKFSDFRRLARSLLSLGGGGFSSSVADSELAVHAASTETEGH